MKNVSLIIDGKNVSVPEDFTILQAAERLNIKIPALCYDPNLEIVAACRLCVVEIAGSKKLETSCSSKVREGMIVNSESEKVVRARKEILQLLLDSHPNDCLTCQKAGECLLQQYSYKYDVKFREHSGAMRPELMDTSSPYILKDNSKCILCGKCVRTCYQEEDRKVLSFSERGYDAKIIFSADDSIEESSCISCNRCVVVCPVGALVDKRQLGKVRSWEAQRKTVSCKVCSYGCEFEVLSKNKNKVAVIAKPPANGRPLCLKGRLTTELMHLDNPDKPYRKIDKKFVASSWAKAIGLADIMEKMEQIDGKKEE